MNKNIIITLAGGISKLKINLIFLIKKNLFLMFYMEAIKKFNIASISIQLG